MESKIARYYGVEPGAVLRWQEVDEGAAIRALVDYGIGGIKVHYIPVADLAVPKPPPAPEELIPVPAVIDLGFDDMSYRELQELARSQGIAANQRKDDLIAALADEEE